MGNPQRSRAAEDNFDWLLQYLVEHPCVDCGERDILVLEFDHVRGAKRDNVTRLARGGWALATVRLEVEKCDVRCANCHRRKTVRGTRRCTNAALRRDEAGPREDDLGSG